MQALTAALTTNKRADKSVAKVPHPNPIPNLSYTRLAAHTANG